jgi:peptide/nickel transport system permease protein
MAAYLVRRLIWTVVIVLVVILIVFVVFFLLPAGNQEIANFAGKQPTPEVIREVTHRLGLDRPWYIRFAKFIKNFFAGDQYGWPGLGYSYENGTPVRQEILNDAPRTLWLIAGAATIWLIFGVGVGVISAVKRRTIFDRISMGLALFFISAPVFFLGPLALLIVWFHLGLTGGTGYTPMTDSVGGWFSHLILPWVVLALLYIGIYARMTRRNLLDTLGEDYIRTARAKGLSERAVIFRHGLRASLTPVVTMFGLDTALLVGGAVLTESIFNIQGVGFLAVQSAFNNDLSSIVGVTLLTAIAVAFANLIVDILYAFLDPRVRYG